LSVRVVAGDKVPRKKKAAVAAAYAEHLAKEGYRVDPNAALTVEITVNRESKSTGVGKQIPHDQLPEEMKQELRRNPGYAWFEKTDVYNMTLQARVLDARGRPALQTRVFGEFAVVKKGASEDVAWDSLFNRGIKVALPRLYLRDAGHKRLLLPRSVEVGVDGLLDPVIRDGPGGVKDGFELPD